MEKELLLIVDCGAHNNQQVAKAVRNAKVYCEVMSAEKELEKIKSAAPKGVILVGDDEAPGEYTFASELGVPVLTLGNTRSQEEIESFLFETCSFTGTWTIDAFIEDMVESIRKQVGDKKVLCALSGGVDSAVCAALVHRAVGDQLTCMFVDHGLMRKGEPELIDEIFRKQFNMDLITINAVDRFLGKLKGVSDPEKKRKIIGKEFIKVFKEESKKLGEFKYLVQGTIYPDIIESISSKGVVKSHHNVGGLPKNMKFELVEPLKWLFKDEVREVGMALGLPYEQVYRQPFPGPGLGVRVIGEITREKLRYVREADAIFREEIANAGLDRSIWQYFALCPGCHSTGVKNGERTYGEAIVLRAVHSSDAMSAQIAEIPYEVLAKVVDRITNEVEGVNRVMYDITPKPNATIEWE